MSLIVYYKSIFRYKVKNNKHINRILLNISFHFLVPLLFKISKTKFEIGQEFRFMFLVT